MEIFEALHSRRSTRAFRPDPIPRETLETILAAAQRSPSYMNTQPWEIAVVTGRSRDELSRILVDLVDKDTPPGPGIPAPPPWPPELETRLKDHASRRASHLGLDLSDPAVRKQMRINNFSFYGAPCALFLFQDSSLGEWSLLDAGIFIQSLMLAAQASGLGVVPQGLIADYPDAVRRHLGIPDAKRLVVGLSLGYPDSSAKINSYQSHRADAGELVKWFV